MPFNLRITPSAINKNEHFPHNVPSAAWHRRMNRCPEHKEFRVGVLYGNNWANKRKCQENWWRKSCTQFTGVNKILPTFSTIFVQFIGHRVFEMSSDLLQIFYVAWRSECHTALGSVNELIGVLLLFSVRCCINCRIMAVHRSAVSIPEFGKIGGARLYFCYVMLCYVIYYMLCYMLC